MITDDKPDVREHVLGLQVVWRNPLNTVQAQLRTRETSLPYYQWANQGTKIRARRRRWNLNHCWAA